MISQQRYMPWVTNSARRALTFRAPFNASGYANLPHDLTINGTTVSPTIRYEGGSATPTVWTATVGDNLPIVGSGDSPTVDEFAPGLTDSRVFLSAAKYYECSTAACGDITTDDYVFELLFKRVGDNVVVNKRQATGELNGWVLWNSASTVVLSMDVGATTKSCVSAALEEGVYYHCMCFMDRSGSGQWYVNGVASGSPVLISAAATTLTSTAKLSIGSDTTSSISCLSLWQAPSWLDTHLQADVAKERFHQCCGIQPTVAKGTAAPSVATRSTSAYIDKLDSLNQSIIVPVGAEWMRVCERKEDGLSTSLRGYLAETQGQNHLLYSEDFTQATAWDVTRSEISCANTEVNPDGSVGACALVGDSAPNTHFVGQAIESVIGPHQFSVFLKAGNKNFAYLDVSSVANCWAYIDLVNHEITSNGIGCTAHVSQIMDGWARYSLCYTGGAADHSHDIYAADSDGDKTYTGDASTANIYMFGAQHEHTAVCHPTSYIKTTTAAVTRTKDQLRYVGGANVGGATSTEGAVTFSSLLPNYTIASGSLRHIALTNPSDHRLLFYTTGSNNTLVVATTTTQANFGNPPSIADGAIHSIKIIYATDNFSTTIDGTKEEDISGAMLTDIDQIDVGSDESAASQVNGLISDLKIYKKPV